MHCKCRVFTFSRLYWHCVRVHGSALEFIVETFCRAKEIRATSSASPRTGAPVWLDAVFVSREMESDLSRTSSGVVSPRNGVNILATVRKGGKGRNFALCQARIPPEHKRGREGEVEEGRSWRSPRFLSPGREMTKELRRGTVARWMRAHTFHGCFRDKRYAGCLDTRENELLEEQSAFPGSLVLQLHANPFAYVVQTTTMSRATPFLTTPCPFFYERTHARLFTNPLRCLRRNFYAFET